MYLLILGGAGPTILTATFLLLGEDVLTYNNGKETYQKSATNCKIRNFGKSIGNREGNFHILSLIMKSKNSCNAALVVRLNLIEYESCFASSGIKNISTYFGTAPKFWNFYFN